MPILRFSRRKTLFIRYGKANPKGCPSFPESCPPLVTVTTLSLSLSQMPQCSDYVLPSPGHQHQSVQTQHVDSIWTAS